ncbi:1717_t:CDS:1, partial [Gigaspora rosea]
FSKYTNRVNEYRTSKEQNPVTSSDDNLSKVHSSVDETMCLDVNATNYLEAYYGIPSPVNSSVYEMRGMESINPLSVFKSAPLQCPTCQSLVTPNGYDTENTLAYDISDISLTPFSDLYSVNDNPYGNVSFELAIPNGRELDSMDDININISELALPHMENSTGYEMHEME